MVVYERCSDGTPPLVSVSPCLYSGPKSYTDILYSYRRRMSGSLTYFMTRPLSLYSRNKSFLELGDILETFQEIIDTPK